jgi:hypothetical protein
VRHAAATHWVREARPPSLTMTNHHRRHHIHLIRSQTRALTVFVLPMRVRHEMFVMSWIFHNAYALSAECSNIAS